MSRSGSFQRDELSFSSWTERSMCWPTPGDMVVGHDVARVPRSIRLRYYVKVPYKRTAPLSRRAVFARDQGKCQYCGKTAESIDHVIPRSKGGSPCWDNVVACCRRCNTYKGDRLLENCSLKLRTVPEAPTAVRVGQGGGGTVPELVDSIPRSKRRPESRSGTSYG